MFIKSKISRPILFLVGIIGLLLIIALVLPQSWQPFASEKRAVGWLIKDDGKDPFNSSRDAVLRYGISALKEISLQTEGFQNLDTIVPAVTVLEIVATEGPPQEAIRRQIELAPGKFMPIIACFIARKYPNDAKDEVAGDLCNAVLTPSNRSYTPAQARLAERANRLLQ